MKSKIDFAFMQGSGNTGRAAAVTVSLLSGTGTRALRAALPVFARRHNRQNALRRYGEMPLLEYRIQVRHTTS